jgi:predicted DNA binding CopG/RHH family protein
MKIIKEKDSETLKSITFRFPEQLLQKLTKLATQSDVSRQKLVTAILEQAINDKKFALKIKD